jgi:hypothetical protein
MYKMAVKRVDVSFMSFTVALLIANLLEHVVRLVIVVYNVRSR